MLFSCRIRSRFKSCWMSKVDLRASLAERSCKILILHFSSSPESRQVLHLTSRMNQFPPDKRLQTCKLFMRNCDVSLGVHTPCLAWFWCHSMSNWESLRSEFWCLFSSHDDHLLLDRFLFVSVSKQWKISNNKSFQQLKGSRLVYNCDERHRPNVVLFNGTWCPMDNAAMPDSNNSCYLENVNASYCLHSFKAELSKLILNFRGVGRCLNLRKVSQQQTLAWTFKPFFDDFEIVFIKLIFQRM